MTEFCILAGGLSSRMGRDKARLRLGGRTLTAHLRRLGRSVGLPVRVVRQDLVPHCGPLGGVHTALRTTHADAVLFAACDMPFVTAALLKRLKPGSRRGRLGLFVKHAGMAGFPFHLRQTALPTVERLLARDQYAIHGLARVLRADFLVVDDADAAQLLNVNTPADWVSARRRAAQGRRRQGADSPTRARSTASRIARLNSSRP